MKSPAQGAEGVVDRLVQTFVAMALIAETRGFDDASWQIRADADTVSITASVPNIPADRHQTGLKVGDEARQAEGTVLDVGSQHGRWLHTKEVDGDVELHGAAPAVRRKKA